MKSKISKPEKKTSANLTSLRLEKTKLQNQLDRLEGNIRLTRSNSDIPLNEISSNPNLIRKTKKRLEEVNQILRQNKTGKRVSFSKYKSEIPIMPITRSPPPSDTASAPFPTTTTATITYSNNDPNNNQSKGSNEGGDNSPLKSFIDKRSQAASGGYEINEGDLTFNMNTNKEMNTSPRKEQIEFYERHLNRLKAHESDESNLQSKTGTIPKTLLKPLDINIDNNVGKFPSVPSNVKQSQPFDTFPQTNNSKSEPYNKLDQTQNMNIPFSNSVPPRSINTQSYGFKPINSQAKMTQSNNKNDFPNFNSRAGNTNNPPNSNSHARNVNDFSNYDSYRNNSNNLPNLSSRNSSNRENNPQQQNQNNNICRKTFLTRLTSIPIFSGETRDSLTQFIDICDSLYFFCQNMNEYGELLMQIIIQLRGEARLVINELNENEFDWADIKELLQNKFKYLSNRDIINSKIENLKQEKNESISDFADRTRKLLNEKNRAYNNLTYDQRDEHDRLARKHFARGINNSKLRERMLLRGSNTIEEAISFAIEMENENEGFIANNELFCKFCRNIGHRERDCRSKEQNSTPVNQLISAMRSLGTNNNNSWRNNRNSFNPRFGGNNFRNTNQNFSNIRQNNGFNQNFNQNRGYFNQNNNFNRRFNDNSNQNNNFNPSFNQNRENFNRGYNENFNRNVASNPNDNFNRGNNQNSNRFNQNNQFRNNNNGFSNQQFSNNNNNSSNRTNPNNRANHNVNFGFGQFNNRFNNMRNYPFELQRHNSEN